jgi:hypothetical protein
MFILRDQGDGRVGLGWIGMVIWLAIKWTAGHFYFLGAAQPHNKKGVDYTYIVWDYIIQIGYNFFHVFSVKMGFLSTDSKYSCIPGDQEGLIFSDFRIFFWRSFLYKLVYYNL